MASGSGTSSDPYIVDTWADFKKYVFTTSGSGKYVILAADIEPTGSDTNGFDAGTFYPKDLNGYYNGQRHAVSNMYLTDSIDAPASIAEIRNIDFINLRCDSSLFYGKNTTGYRYFYATAVKISGFIAGTQLFDSYSYHVWKLSRLAVNIKTNKQNFKIARSYATSSGTPSIENCNFKIEFEGVVPSTSYYFNGWINETTPIWNRNCLYTIIANGGTCKFGRLDDCVIMGEGFEITNDADNCSGVSIYDSSKINAGTIVAGNIRPVSNMKDITELQSTGFPIVEVGDS